MAQEKLPAFPAFTPDQVAAADMLVQGKTPGEVGKELGIAAKTVKEWKGEEVFALLVEQRRTMNPDNNLPAVLRREFGSLDAEDIAKTTLASLLMIMTADPAKLQDEEGNWLPLSQVPPSMRMALKTPGNERQAPQLADRIGAAKVIVNLLELVQQGEQTVNMEVLSDEASKSQGS